MTAETSTTPHRHRHTHRKRAARIYLAVIFVMLCVANSYLVWFSFSVHNPWRALIAVMTGQSIGSVLLLAAVWRRQPWARYVLIAILFLTVFVFGLVALYLGQHAEFADPNVVAGMWAALALLTGAASWLIRSKRIQYLATQPGSGG